MLISLIGTVSLSIDRVPNTEYRSRTVNPEAPTLAPHDFIILTALLPCPHDTSRHGLMMARFYKITPEGA